MELLSTPNPVPPSEAGVDEATSSIISVLLDASYKAVTKPNAKPPRRHKASWSESLSHAMTNSCQAHRSCWCPGTDGRTPKVCPPPCYDRLQGGPIQCHISCCLHPNPAGVWWHNHNTKERKISHYHEQSQRHNYNITHRKSSGTYPGRTSK